MSFNVLAFATDFREAVLGGAPSAGMCAAISGPLRAALQSLGVPCQLMESDLGEINHVFLQMADGAVLDATADQFNWCSRQPLPGVYLGPAAMIHDEAKPWPGGGEWVPLMAELRRLHPKFEPREVGAVVSSVLRALPSCSAAPAL